MEDHLPRAHGANRADQRCLSAWRRLQSSETAPPLSEIFGSTSSDASFTLKTLNPTLLIVQETSTDIKQPLVYSWQEPDGTITVPGATQSQTDNHESDALMLFCLEHLELPSTLMAKVLDTVTPTTTPKRISWPNTHHKASRLSTRYSQQVLR